MRAEKDIRLRIDLLEGQSSFIAKILTRAISEHNEVVFSEYAQRLAVSRGRIEELLWSAARATGLIGSGPGGT